MPRYFFNIEGAGYPAADEEGTVLAGPEQARSAVVTFAGELLRDAESTFWRNGAWQLDVTDEEGAEVCTLTITGTAAS